MHNIDIIIGCLACQHWIDMHYNLTVFEKIHILGFFENDNLELILCKFLTIINLAKFERKILFGIAWFLTISQKVNVLFYWI